MYLIWLYLANLKDWDEIVKEGEDLYFNKEVFGSLDYEKCKSNNFIDQLYRDFSKFLQLQVESVLGAYLTIAIVSVVNIL